jgi:hypothetical protein
MTMGRQFVGVLAVLAMAAALAGCASMPPGVDGNLTDAWPAMPVAKVSVPAVGVCYAARPTGLAAGDEPTTPCSDSHSTETVYVGTFTGADGNRSIAPTANTQTLVNAFVDCRKNASAYLGDDFYMGPMTLQTTVPTDAAWKGGARWYRCDIERYADVNFEIRGGGSAKDGLRGDRPLAITCIIASDSGKDSSKWDEFVPCTKPHNAELAGLFSAPNVPWPADEKARSDMGGKGCEGVVAKFLGLSGTRDTNTVLGWSWEPFDQERWDLGDRTIRCVVLGFKNGAVNGVRFTGSVKGFGNRTPKV